MMIDLKGVEFCIELALYMGCIGRLYLRTGKRMHVGKVCVSVHFSVYINSLHLLSH